MENCKECNNSKHIVNKHFGLCQECNNIRLHGSKYGKPYNVSNKERTSLKTKINRLNHKVTDGIKNKKKSKGTSGKNLKLDEAFYEECFNMSDHKCEECGCRLPTEFRNDEGKINARWRYSHIIAKSIAPEMRHDLNNINHLCLQHHTKWDHGSRSEMKIYEKNKKRLPKYFKD